MKVFIITVLSALVAFTQAAAVPWVTVLPVVLMSFKQAEGFFGIFRRRQPAKAPIIKDNRSPQGPVAFPGFSPQGSANFFNPFGSSGFSQSSGFPQSNGFSQSGRFPSFPSGGFGGNPFQPQQPVQESWMPQNEDLSSNEELPSQFQMQSIPPESEMSQSVQHNFIQEQNFDPQDFDRDTRFDDSPPPINTEEAESFFTLLAETDENKCISRLVCEMGADPQNAGDLGQTVNEIIGSLTNFPPGSKVSEYNEVLTRGRNLGLSSCLSDYTECDEETYNLMKSNQPEPQL